jgi:hypothetical protein
MLKELGAFVEALQRELVVQGRKPTDIEIEVKCKSIVEWAVLDQVVERELREQPGFREEDRHNRCILPHMLTYKDTAVRITYER